MTGTWETKLEQLARGGQPWNLPARDALISSLSQLQSALANVASHPGLLGECGNAAGESFEQASTNVAKQIEYLKGDIEDALRDANSLRGEAERLLGTLGSGQLGPQSQGCARATRRCRLVPRTAQQVWWTERS